MRHISRFRLAPWALATLVASAAAATAQQTPAPPDCSKAGLRKARAAAGQETRRKDYKAAIAALAPLASACGEGGGVERGWLASDLAVAYLENGQLVECKKLVDDALDPKSDIARAGNDKLTSALAHNGELCEKALVAQYGPFSSAPCPLTVDDAASDESGRVAATTLPAALRPKGASAACLALVGGDSARGKVVCPHLVLVQQKEGKVTRRALRTEKSGLADPTFCCGYDTVAVGGKSGTPMVRVGASMLVRECSGGSARSTLDEVLEWKRDVLTVVVDASAMVE